MNTCQNCGAEAVTGERRLRFRRRSGPSKTVTVELCEICSEAICSEEWIQVLRA